jgi:tRNA/tmRNA/rRNA uracil-C5-methylase (TrmA/RlmC/RlmD family)
VRLGYYAADNTTVIDVPACPLALAPLNACLAERRADPSFLRTLRNDMPVTFRWTARDGAAWWRGRASDQDVWLVEDSVIGPLAVPRNSFYQMNPAMADRLVAHVRDRLAALQPEAAIDLFCGIGVFALAAAKAGVPHVTGVDLDGPGIRAADYNARQHGAAAITWQAGKAEDALRGPMAGLPWAKTLLIVDPPRSGLGRGLIRHLARQRPGRLLYISCAADTLTRDAAWLQEAGYRVETARLFDMFPRTAHFESVTEFVLA